MSLTCLMGVKKLLLMKIPLILISLPLNNP